MTLSTMSDDKPPSQKKNLISRIKQLMQGEPQSTKELEAVIKKAKKRDVITEDTKEMIQGVLDVTTLKVRDVMIPRSQIVAIQKNLTLPEIIQKVVHTTHSRFPVIHDDKDHIEGILLAKDLLKHSFNHPELDFELRDIIRPAVVVPESKRVDVLLKEFRSKRYHMAIVVDEYGGVSGLITIEDILEEIVGDIEDEYDLAPEQKNYIKKVSKNQFHIDALTPIEEFNTLLNTQLSDEEFDTIGGLVAHAFGHLPQTGESITLEKLVFTVLKADTRRIIKLDVRINPTG